MVEWLNKIHLSQKGIASFSNFATVLYSQPCYQENETQMMWFGKEHIPAGTCRRSDVVLMSMRRHHVISTSVRRYFDLICLLGLTKFQIQIISKILLSNLLFIENVQKSILQSVSLVGWCDGAG